MFKTMFKRKPHSEAGFTLVEILVAVGLFVVLTSAITATAIIMSNSANKFAESSTSTNQAADTIATITRDISSAVAINVAENYYLNLTTQEDNQNFDVTYFIWNPSDNTEVQVPYGVATADLPDVPAIMQLRKPLGDSSVGTLKVMVEGYNIFKQTSPLFVYYDINNLEIATPVVGTDLQAIERVEFGFALKVVDRSSLIEMYSSANPRFSNTNLVNGGTISFIDSCVVPTFTGTLTPQTTTAVLSWTEVPSANTYTIYRSNLQQSVSPQVVKVINNYATTSWTDPDITWGEKYDYYIIAGCQVGKSVRSATVSLTATPEKTAIANINSTTQKSLTATLAADPETGTTSPLVGSRYTVARGLTNQVVWHKVNGAKGYRIYRNGTQISDASWTANNYFQDTARNYGETAVYTVVAYNDINTNTMTGGDATTSEQVTLYSPPSAPGITITANNADTSGGAYTFNNINLTSVSGAKVNGYKIYRNINDNTNTNSCPATGYTYVDTVVRSITGVLMSDTNQAWGKTYCYKIIPFNDAGDGAETISAIMRPPGAVGNISFAELSKRFIITNNYYFWFDESGTQSAFRTYWSSASGASNYVVSKTKLASVGSQTDSNGDNYTTSTSTDFGNTTPGTPYNVTVTARANNGATRTSSAATYVTAPEPPATIDSIIQANNSGQKRRMVDISQQTAHGNNTTNYGHVYFADQGYWSSSIASSSRGGGRFQAYSAGYSGGNSPSDVWSNYSAYGYSQNSVTVSWTGWTNRGYSLSGCNDFCNAPEQYPDYANGAHAWLSQW